MTFENVFVQKNKRAMSRFIDQRYRHNLSKYRYSGVDKSLLSRYVLGPYWNALVKLFPMWMAPNTITTLGFLCILVNLLTLLAISPDLSEPCPNWMYFTFAIGLWIYASFDAIDGKQARRTGTSGPLGELFDHCCDAINTTLSVFMFTSAMGFGQSWEMTVMQMFALVNFYLTTWEEYHTGTLYLSYFSGPVEGIILLCLAYIITGIGGVGFWRQDLRDTLRLATGSLPWLPHIQLNYALVLFSAVVVIGNIVTSSFNVISTRRSKNLAVLPALSGLLPLGVMVALSCLWLAGSPLILYEHLVAFTLYIGICFSYSVGLMITAHLTRAPFPYFNATYYTLILGTLNASLPLFGVKKLLTNDQERLYLYACLLFAAALYGYFVVVVINDVCDYCGIHCFSIKRAHSNQEKTANGNLEGSEKKLK